MSPLSSRIVTQSAFEIKTRIVTLSAFETKKEKQASQGKGKGTGKGSKGNISGGKGTGQGGKAFNARANRNNARSAHFNQEAWQADTFRYNSHKWHFQCSAQKQRIKHPAHEGSVARRSSHAVSST